MANVKGAKSLFDLMFLHNTSADKLARIDQMGGMPMPSIAVTQKDIPFEDYGDITLIGRKDPLSPNRQNKYWDADAYTVRAPSPFRIANKGAGKQFDADYEQYDKYGYTSSARSSIWDLEGKSSAHPHEYGNAINFFESNGSALAKFADDMGIAIPEGADAYKLREIRDANRFAFDKWVKDETNKYFKPDQYFLQKPSVPTDTGRTRAVIKPYTADEVAKFMKKSAGAAQEGSMAVKGTGGARSAFAERLKSLDQMRAKRDMLAPREDLAIDHETLSMTQQDLMEELKPYYKYSADGWMYTDEAGGMLMDSGKKGLDRSMAEYGFENVPPELKQRIVDWQQALKTAPTQYFEGKPERVVSLKEFAGAIAPQDTPQGIIDMLTKQGIDVQRYADDSERTALRNKFQSEMFTNPASLLGSLGVTGAVGYSALNPNTAQANPIDQLRASEQQFDMSPVEQLRASEREFMAPNAVSDVYDRANEFFDKERQAAQESGATLGEWLIPDYEYSQKRAMGDKSATTGLLSMLEKLDPVGYIGLINAIGKR